MSFFDGLLKVGSLIPGPQQAILGGVAGLLGAGRANAAADAQAQQGYAAMLEDERRRRQMQDIAMEHYRQAEAAGQFDASRQIGLLRDSNRLALDTGLGAGAAASRVMGYRPGDSEPLQAMSRMSQSAALRLAGMEEQARGDAYERQTAAQSRLQGAYAQPSSYGRDMVTLADGRRVNPSGLVGAMTQGTSQAQQDAFSGWLSGVFKMPSKKPAASPIKSSPMQSPYSVKMPDPYGANTDLKVGSNSFATYDEPTNGYSVKMKSPTYGVSLYGGYGG